MGIRRIGAAVKNLFLAAVIIAVLAAAFVIFANGYFFRTENINITVNNSSNKSEIYTYDEVLEASGIVLGGELFGIDVKRAKSGIRESLAYAETVKIKRTPPSTVDIEVTTGAGLFGITLDGDYYIITDNFMVAEKIKTEKTGKTEGTGFNPPDGIITLEANAVRKCRVGEKIEFSDKDIYDFLKEVALLYKSEYENNEEFLVRITGIDITNKFKVTMNYGDKFLVRLGIFENISFRILSSFEIIENLPYYAEGIIDLTNGKAASFTHGENVPELYKSGRQSAG